MVYQPSSKDHLQFKLTALLVTRGFALAALLLLAIIAGRYVQSRLGLTAASRAQAALWDVNAPPCPTMDRAGFAEFHNYAPLGINLWDTQIERRAGDGNCILVSPSLWEGADYMSCHFTNPIFLRIVRGGEERFFRLGTGPATLRLEHDGTVRCVAG